MDGKKTKVFAYIGFSKRGDKAKTFGNDILLTVTLAKIILDIGPNKEGIIEEW